MVLSLEKNQKAPSHRSFPMAPPWHWVHWVHRAPVLPSLDDLHGQGLAIAVLGTCERDKRRGDEEAMQRFFHSLYSMYIHLNLCICKWYIYIYRVTTSIDIQIFQYTDWYFSYLRDFLGPPSHLNIRNPICLHIQLNIRMELVFHTTSGASRSRQPSTDLNVVTVGLLYVIIYIYSIIFNCNILQPCINNI